ncbi:MAG: prohibitin family protein [Pseudobutyrivibrio sp.]|nr:prohibitin family protein [Pseudobutyrivibrio sp.]
MIGKKVSERPANAGNGKNIFKTILIIFVVLVLFKMCVIKVPTGYVGVVYNMNGGVDGEILSQGWHIILPTKKVTTYTIGIEQSYLTSDNRGDSPDNDSFEVPSSDGKGLTVDLTYTYRFDETTIANTFTRFKGKNGESVRDTFIKPNIISWTKEVTAQYPVTDILGDERANLNLALTEYIQTKFAPYGIIVENVSLINIDADDETREAVQQKVNAQQQKELAEIEAQTAKINAQKEKEVAMIEAETKKVQAQGTADAKLIEAQADAEANKLLSESITQEILEQQKIEKWDGKLPTVQGNSNAIIDVRDMAEVTQ